VTQPTLHHKSLFLEALAIESQVDRDTFLREACADNDGLRSEIESLLQAHSNPPNVLKQLSGDQNLCEVPDPIGTTIGPYTLREQIGEGGMGVVYVAEQSEPVRRKVALKLIKPGMDSKQVIARFEAERQTLALMDHPNIAKILDAGVTGEVRETQATTAADSNTETPQSAIQNSQLIGRPYFVMELVRGLSITEYCNKHSLSTRERLELFITVCRAVQHAHQKGIIHRDIKPTNVLVTRIDGQPVPKVIDFGVAKATSGQLEGETVYTHFAEMIGTPLYMSPEQAEMSDVDVDTRSDVYSLGVVLYELLAGNTPFDRETLKQANPVERLRIIREDEPPKPSARIGTLNAANLSTISTQRGSDPKTLSRQIGGELDWIVMKALEKKRNDRYASANDLAADVGRYLADEPIHARPYSLRRRMRRVWRRAKGPATVLFLILTSLVIGAIFNPFQDEHPKKEPQMFFSNILSTLRNAVTSSPSRRKSSRGSVNTQAGIESLEDRLMLTAFVVDSNLDTVDANDGQTTLREAITAANANVGHDTISFNIGGGVGPQTISLANALPTVTDQITIDGSTQPGIVIDATGVGGTVLLLFGGNADGSNLQDFSISNAQGTALQLTGVANSAIDDLDLSYAGSGAVGIGLRMGASDNNMVRNVTATNRSIGIELQSVDDNLFEQNNVSQASSYGIYILGNSDANVFQQNDASSSHTGIRSRSTGLNNQFVDNDLSGTVSWGLRIKSDTQFVATGNDFTDSGAGVRLQSMDGITLSTSTTFDIDVSKVTGTGLGLVSVTNSTIDGLDLSYVGNTAQGTGLSLFLSDNNTVQNVTSANRSIGIGLGISDDNRLEQNNVSQAGLKGIGISQESSRNVVRENNASGSFVGINVFVSGSGNQIVDNDLSGTVDWGLSVLGDSEFVATGNDFTGSGNGIYLAAMDGITLTPTTFDIDVSTVTGTGLSLVGVTNSTIDGLDFSYSGNSTSGTGLKLVNSDANTVKNVTTTNRDIGIELRGAVDTEIHCAEITDNGTGLLVAGNASGVTISDSQIEGNDVGIENEGTNIVLAENNYWGAANGPSNLGGSGDGYTGNVDADPFLTSLPDCLVDVQTVNIDVKPDSDSNTTNLAANGVLPVVIYTTADFDASTVIGSSVTFAGASASYFALEDVDGDGDLDLVLHFRIQEMVELNADYRDALAADLEDGVIDDNHQSIKVTLRGETTDGISIEGSDTIDAFFAGKKFRDFVDSLE
jgi:CSLREA domain-containing protein